MIKPCIMVGPFVGETDLEDKFVSFTKTKLQKYSDINDIFVSSDNFDKYVIDGHSFQKLDIPEASYSLLPKGFFFEDQRIYQYYAMMTSYELTLLDYGYYVVDHIYPIIYEDDYYNLKQFEVK